ncbi:hypothetical protein ONS96_003891 [Cadophora gregata f. sp. sojae]|nr:hypothetical protein ONS96_003891 [Cadophora gregata f. sp. sojae]
MGLAFILFSMSFFLPETPRWLARNGFKKEALQTVADLHSAGDINDESVQHVFMEIQQAVKYEATMGKATYRFAQLNGINVISFYLPSSLAAAGFDNRRSLLFTGANALIYTAATVPVWWLADRWGRRPLLIFGGIAMAIALSIMCVFNQVNGITVTTRANGIFSFVVIYNSLYGATWGPMPWLLPAEIFPLRARSKGMALATFSDCKACDRCKSQKKRCDLERPCRHCVRAQKECRTQPLETVKKVRARRQTDTPTPASPLQSNNPPRPFSQQTSESTPRQTDAGQDDMVWSARTASSASDNQTPRPPQAQVPRENSSLPGFDADSALATARKIFGSQKSQAFRDRATSAIPGGGCRDTNGTNSSNIFPAPLIPVFDIIGIELPDHEVCNKLLETYFSSVHWFSLVIYEPKFRGRYTAVVGSGLASRSDHGFLLLLLMVLIMGC